MTLSCLTTNPTAKTVKMTDARPALGKVPRTSENNLGGRA